MDIAAQAVQLLLLAMLQSGYAKLADGTDCTTDDQCDGGYCAIKKVIINQPSAIVCCKYYKECSKQTDVDIQSKPTKDKIVCCSRQYYESCSTSCTWVYYGMCDQCCGRLKCKNGRCGLENYAIEHHLTSWSEWTYTWSTGGVNTRLQVCVDERLQHRYRTAPDFYNYPTVEFKPLTHTSICEINVKCHEPVCTDTVTLSGTTLNYMGCFYSERHFFNDMIQQKPMDPLICQQYCSKQQGVRFYGVYHNSFCGCVDKIYSTLSAPVYQDERKCTEKCVGNSGLTCGGLDAANVYCINA